MRQTALSDQEIIINLLIEHLSKPHVARIFQEELNISKATSYKYLNNLTEISYNTMRRLLDNSTVREIIENDIKLDAPDIVRWQYPLFNSSYVNTESYLYNLLGYLKLLDPSETRLTLTTYEIPIFYYMYFPELFAFKIFCWSKTIWMDSDQYPAKFDSDEILSSQVLSAISEICDRFNSIPSEEYWTESMFDNTIRQIAYFRDAELFINIKQIRSLVSELYNLVELLRAISQNGQKMKSDRKSAGVETNISKNDIYYTNNIFVVESPKYNFVFNAFDNPNFMHTADIRVKNRTLDWLRSMKRHCTSLTQNNEVKRNDYFNCLIQSVDSLGFAAS